MLETIIKQHIIQKGNAIGFDAFMQLALYHLDYGYYRRAQSPFGAGGDFVTAPEISPLFGAMLAKHYCQLKFSQQANNILEFGAGSGALAIAILSQLAQLKQLPTHYFILEISGARQKEQQIAIKKKLPKLYQRVVWLTELPKQFSGLMIANEVLDAMPCKRFLLTEQQNYQLCVDWQDNHFKLKKIPYQPPFAFESKTLPKPYTTEVNQLIKPWLKSLDNCLDIGQILIVDYGYDEKSYYHPMRQNGTLRCFHQQKITTNPLVNIGNQDITASVDFSALKRAADDCQLTLAGYTTQAHFLINLGIAQALNQPADTLEKLKENQQIKQLFHPDMMGEVFKVMALNKKLTVKLDAFCQFDLSHKL